LKELAPVPGTGVTAATESAPVWQARSFERTAAKPVL
jgi:hypothetical protein